MHWLVLCFNKTSFLSEVLLLPDSLSELLLSSGSVSFWLPVRLLAVYVSPCWVGGNISLSPSLTHTPLLSHICWISIKTPRLLPSMRWQSHTQTHSSHFPSPPFLLLLSPTFPTSPTASRLATKCLVEHRNTFKTEARLTSVNTAFKRYSLNVSKILSTNRKSFCILKLTIKPLCLAVL